MAEPVYASLKGDLASTAGQVGGRKSRRSRRHRGGSAGPGGATAKTVGGTHETPKPTTNAMTGGRKSRRKMSTGAKNWVQFVKQVYKTNLAKNPNYKYKQAMKDAAKLKKKNKTMKM